MLDAELKAKWIEALRSGKYQQTKNTIADGRGYCCLGVLCIVDGTKSPDTSAYPHISHLIPDWKVLANMNDGGKSFKQIATYIENTL